MTRLSLSTQEIHRGPRSPRTTVKTEISEIYFPYYVTVSSPPADLWVMDNIIPAPSGGRHWQGCSEIIR